MTKKKLILWSPSPTGQKMRIGQQLPPLALGIIAALTPQDEWDISIYDSSFDDFKVEDCDLVGISAMTCQINEAYDMARQYYEKGIPVVLGGVHPTLCTEESLKFVDVVVKGEAELIWNDILEDFKKGKLKKIYEAKTIHNLKNLPIPPRFFYRENHYKMGIIQTTRGCPMDCEYCAVTTFNGKSYRKRPINEVLDELIKIPQKVVFFADDNLIGFSKQDNERFKELCKGIINRGIKKEWMSQAPLQFSEDEELLKLASKAGMAGVLLGIESINSKVLSGNMNKKMNVKYIQQGNFIKKIHKYGIAVMGMFILGNDEDEIDCFKKTYEAIKKFKIDIPSIQPLMPYPATKLWNRLKKEGRLYAKELPNDWKYIEKKFPMFKLNKMTDKELQEGFRWLYKRVYTVRKIIFRSLRTLFYSRRLAPFLNALFANIAWYINDVPRYKKNKNF